MDKIVKGFMGIFLIFLLFVFSIDAQKKYWLPVIPPYNLKSDERYTKYLPARVKALRREINNNGLAQAINLIRDDHDLESYLFILSCEKPVKLLAYSRQPQLFDKTAAELQPLIFTLPVSDQLHDVSVVFDQWISTAHKGDTYIPYFWRFNNKDQIQIQTAYVSSIIVDGLKNVIGAAVFVKHAPDYLILPHRTQTFIDRLKKEEFENWLTLINHDDDPDLYFFLVNFDPPVRWIAHGRNDWLVGKTLVDGQKKLYPLCSTIECDLVKVFNDLVDVASHCGGYTAYEWRARPEDPIQLKVSYTMPVIYKKKKLLVGTGHTPLNFPERLSTQLSQAVDNAIKLIKEVGLDNTISVLKKTNNKKLYLFIIEQSPPYKSVLDIIDELETNAGTATVFAKKMGPEYAVDYVRFRGEMSRFAQKFGGWYAYEYKTPAPGVPDMLKIAYIKSFTFNGVNYFIGATYQTLD